VPEHDEQRRTLLAGEQVTADVCVLPLADAVTGVGSETFGERAAGLGADHRDVRLEISLPEPFAGPVRQRGDGRRVDPELRGDLGRSLFVDDRAREYVAPALRQGRQGPGRQGELDRREYRVDAGLRRLEPGQVRDRAYSRVPPGPVAGDAPDRSAQIGTHRLGRPVAAADRAQHLGERLGAKVVGLRGIARPAPGVPER
jgi:hypothetical protein